MNDWFEFEHEICGHRGRGVLRRDAVAKIRKFKE